MTYVPCPLSPIAYHLSPVSCHIYHVKCHLSCVSNKKSHINRSCLCLLPSLCTVKCKKNHANLICRHKLCFIKRRPRPIKYEIIFHEITIEILEQIHQTFYKNDVV